MYKVMLIDDDVPMVKYLMDLIPWKSMGMEISATAYNSLMATELFQETLPDLVITDIGLPETSGLELALTFRQLKPECRIIFLTCHEDFSYLKQAMRLDADHYFIKDELTAEQLITVLNKSIEELKRDSSYLDSLSFQDTVNKNRDIMIQTYTEQLMQGRGLDSLFDFGRKMGVSWDHSSFILTSIFIDFSSMPKQYAVKDVPLIKYAVFNIAGEIASQFRGIVPLISTQNEVWIVMNFSPTMSINHYEVLRDFLKKLHENVQKYIKVFVGFYYGLSFEGVVGLREAKLQLVKNKDRCFYEPVEYSYNVEKLASTLWNPSGSQMLYRYKEILLQACKEQDEAAQLQVIQEFADIARVNRPSPKAVREVMVQWIRAVGLMVQDGSTTDEAEYMLLESAHLSSLQTVMVHSCRKLSQNNRSTDVQREPKLAEIDKYILMYLSTNISSIDLAKHLHLNPSYFSRYFKKMTGENFTDYVHQFKMNVALQLLDERKESSEMLSIRLGYCDRTYFSKIFKKYTHKNLADFKKNYDSTIN